MGEVAGRERGYSGGGSGGGGGGSGGGGSGGDGGGGGGGGSSNSSGYGARRGVRHTEVGYKLVPTNPVTM